MSRGTHGALALLAALLSSSAPLRAELGEDAERLIRAWGAHGRAKRLAPRFAERGAPTVIFLPTDFVTSASHVCTSLAILGPPSTHFTVRAVGESANDDDDDEDSEGASDGWPEPSLAGLIQLTRCGKRRSRLAAVLVELRSPRAVLETIVVETRVPLVSAVEVLPQRNPGPIEPLEARTPRAPPPPLNERLERARARLAREGAIRVTAHGVPSSREGTAQYRRPISEGCYRLAFFAEPPERGGPERELALLPEKSDALSVVALENGDGFDASVTFCAGERTELVVGVSGVASSPVQALIAEWPLPRGFPESWGGRGRARVAATLFKHRVRVDGAPIDQALGVQGPTWMPLPVEPGACYVGVLVAVRGTAQALTLSGAAGHDRAHNHAGPGGGDGTLISLCAHARTHALFEADARGTSLFWLFALFQNGRVAVGGERD